MKMIACWNDLSPFGIQILTGEACGLMYRVLCDLTENGKKIIERCFDVRIQPPEAWNSGVGCIMLTHEMLVPLAVFALLESGCKEAYTLDHSVIGIEPDDDVEKIVAFYKDRLGRRFAYQGTAGSRNQHMMSGRIV